MSTVPPLPTIRVAETVEAHGLRECVRLGDAQAIEAASQLYDEAVIAKREHGPAFVVERYCPHCDAVTAQVGDKPANWPSSKPDTYPNGPYALGHCLQCIADGANCCDLDAFDRWAINAPDEPLPGVQT